MSGGHPAQYVLNLQTTIVCWTSQPWTTAGCSCLVNILRVMHPVFQNSMPAEQLLQCLLALLDCQLIAVVLGSLLAGC